MGAFEGVDEGASVGAFDGAIVGADEGFAEGCGVRGQLASVPSPSSAQRPLLQAAHVVCVLSYLPAGHAVHAVCSSFVRYPPGHDLQLNCPALEAQLPSSQASHDVR